MNQETFQIFLWVMSCLLYTSYKFVAEPFHVDFTGRLTMGVLGNHLLNCAGFHASDRGFGIATLNAVSYTHLDVYKRQLPRL